MSPFFRHRKVERQDGPLLYAAEPRMKPIRMYCRCCHAQPGEPCTAQASPWAEKHPIRQIHECRKLDFDKLRTVEMRLETWNAVCTKEGHGARGEGV